MYGNQYANNQQPQGQPLVADPTRPQVHAIQIQQGNPPFLPQINVPGELTNYLNWIVSALMLEVQEKAALNPARMYAFNLMAPNMFATNEFVNLSQLAVNHIDAVMRTSNNASIEHCIDALIPDLVGKYCLALCAYYPDLYGFLDPTTANHVNSAIHGMQSIANTIAQVQQAVANGNRNGVQQQMIGGRLTGNYQTYQGRQSPHAAAVGGGGGTSGADRLFSGGAQGPAPTTQLGTPTNDGTVSRYARQAQKRLQEEQQARNTYQSTYRSVDASGAGQQDQEQPAKVGGFQPINRVRSSNPGFQLPKPITPAAVTPSTAQPAAQAVAPVVVKPISLNQPEQLTWKPSEAQPYRTVFDFTKFKAELVRVGQDVIQVLKPLTPEEVANMNIEDHALTRPPLQRYDAVSQVTEEAVTDRTPEVPTFALEFHDDSLLELATGITSTITGLRWAIAKSSRVDPNVAKCYPAVMVEPIAVEERALAEKHNNIIERLAECDTFEKAVAILDEIHDSPEDRMFFNRINELLTQELNNVLMMNFTKFWMDSFYEDVLTLLPAIAKQRGAAVVQAFMGKQRLFFQQFIMAISQGDLQNNMEFMVQEYIQNKDENPAEWDCKFVVLPWLTSFTHLNLPSYELNISLKPGETGTLDEKHTKELWSLADQILNNEATNDARRHYLVASDGVKFLLMRGYIKEDAYLVRRILEVA